MAEILAVLLTAISSMSINYIHRKCTVSVQQRHGGIVGE